jgi:hypothetical protein
MTLTIQAGSIFVLTDDSPRQRDHGEPSTKLFNYPLEGSVRYTSLMPINPYYARRIDFLRVLDRGEWRFKIYTIDYRNADVAYDQFTGGMRLGFGELPDPPRVAGRPGVGFAIAHQGKGADYLIFAWWDRENELPLRVFIREPDAEWRIAQGSESVCVWDLQVIAHERDAYVKHVMRVDSDIEAYLADKL